MWHYVEEQLRRSRMRISPTTSESLRPTGTITVDVQDDRSVLIAETFISWRSSRMWLTKDEIRSYPIMPMRITINNSTHLSAILFIECYAMEMQSSELAFELFHRSTQLPANHAFANAVIFLMITAWYCLMIKHNMHTQSNSVQPLAYYLLQLWLHLPARVNHRKARRCNGWKTFACLCKDIIIWNNSPL